jgi:hypothetical protein
VLEIKPIAPPWKLHAPPPGIGAKVQEISWKTALELLTLLPAVLLSNVLVYILTSDINA